jgi:1-acyl-sn-glycerol-3-phosphate acyltransferase
VARWLWYCVNPFQTLLCFVWTVGSILTVGVAMLCGAKPTLGMRAAQRPWSTVVLWIVGARLERVGFPESLDGTKLFVANHQSVIDVTVLVRALPPPLHFIAKTELFRLPIFGWYLRRTGMIPVDRRGGAGRLGLAAAVARTGGGGIVAFPEGTRSRDGQLGAFKRGSFAAAIAAQIPVVPIAIENAAQVVGRSGFTGRPGVIRLHYGREIQTAGLGQSARGAVADQARDEVARLLGLERGGPASTPQVGRAVDVDDAPGGEGASFVGQE